MLKPDNTAYRWVVLIVAFITLVLGYAIRNCFSVFYPTIVAEFGWQRGETALIFSFSIIIYGFIAPLAGGLVDRFRPRVILPIGAVLMGGGAALCSRATTQWEFYFFYGVMVAAGLSLAGWTPLTTIVSRWFVKKRGLAYGIMTAGFGGSLIYASIAQFLISTFGWKTAYIIIGGSSMTVIVTLCGLFMRRGPKHTTITPDDKTGSPQNADNRYETRSAESLRQKWEETDWTLSRALKTYQFWLLVFVGFFLLGIAEHIIIAHQVYFFLDVGYRPMLAANIYSMFGVAFLLGNICSFSSDRLGREKIFMPGCLLCAVSVLLLFFIKDASRPELGFLSSILFGLGMGLAAPVFFTVVADLFSGRNFGSIQGTVIFGFSFGGAFSPWLAGFLHDKTGSYDITYLVLLVALCLCMLLMWFIAPHKIRPVAASQKE